LELTIPRAQGRPYAESLLIHQIESVLVNKEALETARLTFGTKVKLAVALGKVDASDVGGLTRTE
jgi:hypothetical protein